MAYTFFPKTIQELEKKTRSGYDPKVRAELSGVFLYLKEKFPALDTPINMDLGKRKSVNISRSIQEDTTINKIKRDNSIRLLSMKFGNGSSGNRGVANRGNLFEGQFDRAFNDWWSGETVSDRKMLDAIEDLNKTYKLTHADKVWTEIMGAENTRRPLQFNGRNITLKNPKGTGYDVGKNVTDITLYYQNGSKINEVYLSLKLGTTTTFFNVGVKKILSRPEIESGNIQNRDGLALLNLFGIDQTLFCMVFNGTLKQGVVTDNTIDKPRLMNLLRSGVGHGYHVIHKMTGKILSEKMDKQAMEKAIRIGSSKVYYGGKTGTGKRVDVEVESNHFIFKLNIRDTQGKDGYPSRLMCDFTHK